MDDDLGRWDPLDSGQAKIPAWAVLAVGIRLQICLTKYHFPAGRGKTEEENDLPSAEVIFGGGIFRKLCFVKKVFFGTAFLESYVLLKRSFFGTAFLESYVLLKRSILGTAFLERSVRCKVILFRGHFVECSILGRAFWRGHFWGQHL